MVEEALIEGVSLFRDLNVGAQRALAARGELRRYSPDEVLWLPGDDASHLHVVLEGAVRVVRSLGGRQHVVHVEGAGGTLGDVAMFAGGHYPATAIAATQTVCLAFDRDGLLGAIGEDPKLALALLSRLALRVRHLIERLDRATAQSVPARLAGFLLARHEAGGGGSFVLGQTQQAVAEELGTVREVVVRALRQLRDDGLIANVGRGRFRVVDYQRLRATAGTSQG
jgi:CRP/FNR family transcriptional regulator